MLFLAVKFRFFSLHFGKINLFCTVSGNDPHCEILIEVIPLIISKCTFLKSLCFISHKIDYSNVQTSPIKEMHIKLLIVFVVIFHLKKYMKPISYFHHIWYPIYIYIIKIMLYLISQDYRFCYIIIFYRLPFVCLFIGLVKIFNWDSTWL